VYFRLQLNVLLILVLQHHLEGVRLRLDGHYFVFTVESLLKAVITGTRGLLLRVSRVFYPNGSALTLGQSFLLCINLVSFAIYLTTKFVIVIFGFSCKMVIELYKVLVFEMSH
jgi:hypothetical protein